MQRGQNYKGYLRVPFYITLDLGGIGMELLAYDIFDNKTRRIFRNHLKSIGYVEVQKSLYFSMKTVSEGELIKLKEMIKEGKNNRFIIVPLKKDYIWKFEKVDYMENIGKDLII